MAGARASRGIELRPVSKRENIMLVRVKVFPQARQEQILKKTKNSFEVWVKERPIQGQANRAVTRVLAEYFEVPSESVKLVKGFRQRSKVFEVRKARPLRK